MVASLAVLLVYLLATSPEAASGGVIALVEDGDEVIIDIPNRSIRFECQ